jgi:hypothetical protein
MHVRRGLAWILMLAAAGAAASRVAGPRPGAATAAGAAAGGPLFVDSGQSLGGANDTGVALADLDDDGDLDAFTVTSGSAPHLVWVNQGGAQGGTPGTFLDSGQALGSWSGTDVALGDVDGDGDADAYVAHDGTNPDRVWLNDGAGLFADSGQTLGTASSQAVALADLDADGDLDAVVGSLGGAQVWANQGGAQGGVEGTFQALGAPFAPCNVLSLAVGRLDAGSAPDLFVGCGGSTQGAPDRVYLGTGDGAFVDTLQQLGSTRTCDLALLDADGDADLDAWAGTCGQPGQDRGDRLWLNQGGGVFLGTGSTFGDDDTRGVATGDFDGDGDPDLFATNLSGIDRVWLNQGGGGFADAGDELGFDLSFDVALGDVDGDGSLDAFVAAFGPDHLWLGTVLTQETPGIFQAPAALDAATSGGGFELVAAADLDVDLDPDLVYGPDDSGALRTRINQGGLQGGTAGDFLPGPTLDDLPTTWLLRFALGDLDGDSDPDLFLLGDAFFGDAEDRVYFNQGGAQGGEAGRFVDSGQRLGARNGAEVLLVDVERDGDLDAVVRNAGESSPSSEPNELWLNQGGAQGGTPGSFAASGQELGASVWTIAGEPVRTAAGDLDGDGDVDLVLADAAGLRVHLNQGGVQGGAEGDFLAAGPPLRYTAASLASPALADFDGDDDLDLAATPGSGLVVYLNDGAGGFVPAPRCPSASQHRDESVVAGDFDLDGLVDLAASGYLQSNPSGALEGTASPALAVHLGEGAGRFSSSGQCLDVPEPGESDWRPELIENLSVVDLDLDGDPDLLGLRAFGLPPDPRRVVLIRNGGPPGYERCCAAQVSVLGTSRFYDPAAEACVARPPSIGASPLAGESPDGLVDLAVFARLRSPWLPERSDGAWVSDFYSAHELEVALRVASNPVLLRESIDALRLWQDDLGLLLAGDGDQALVSQEEIDSIETFLDSLRAEGSPELAQAIADRLAALPPLQTLVGMSVEDASVLIVGVWTPYFAAGFESGDASAWSAVVP